jgi:hypothetical protein
VINCSDVQSTTQVDIVNRCIPSEYYYQSRRWQ